MRSPSWLRRLLATQETLVQIQPASHMMTPQEYILSTIKALKAPIVMENIPQGKLEDAIYAKVMSKKFRKVKPGEPAVKLTKEAIRLAVTENKPIRIVQMFGGNKLWRFEEAPEIDWAELFSLTYFIQWCRYIASVYEPGVIYEYFSQDISVETMNNVPRAETDKYSKTFKELLDWIHPYIPPQITVSYLRHFEMFNDPQDYYKELEKSKTELFNQNGNKLPELTDIMKAATELNVKLKPGQDDDPEWREKVELEHQAIFMTPTLRRYADDPHIIWTCPTYFADSVVTGSTKRSYAKFWAGVGALQKNGDSYAELVLTPKQVETMKFEWQDINIEGISGKNFKKIRIVD